MRVVTVVTVARPNDQRIASTCLLKREPTPFSQFVERFFSLHILIISLFFFYFVRRGHQTVATEEWNDGDVFKPPFLINFASEG